MTALLLAFQCFVMASNINMGVIVLDMNRKIVTIILLVCMILLFWYFWEKPLTHISDGIISIHINYRQEYYDEEINDVSGFETITFEDVTSEQTQKIYELFSEYYYSNKWDTFLGKEQVISGTKIFNSIILDENERNISLSFSNSESSTIAISVNYGHYYAYNFSDGEGFCDELLGIIEE